MAFDLIGNVCHNSMKFYNGYLSEGSYTYIYTLRMDVILINRF